MFFIGCHGCGGIFCMGSFPRSYKYGKIRVRLMRTEEDVNENRSISFTSGAARCAPALVRSAYAYIICFAFALGRKLARSMRARRFREGLRGRRINAFRSRGFGHVREYTPVALLHKAAFLRATSQASTARLAAREILDKNAIFGTFAMPEISRFFILLGRCLRS